jgi:prevent-host-death family protein
MAQMITFTASEANRSFSKLLRLVKEGAPVRITSHGQTVAVVKPPEQEEDTRERQLKALAVLKKRWATQENVTVGPWTREELYERERN